jgi:VIT1/CCC1 family predicted Fe2+/Mn2+ transporter
MAARCADVRVRGHAGDRRVAAGPEGGRRRGGPAGFSSASFASGAVVPILPFLFVFGTAAIVAAVVVGVALFATGTTVGVLTGGPSLRRGLRQLGIGVAAAAVTYGLGRVFGTVVG